MPDDIDTRRTIHNCTDSFAFIPNEPKTFKLRYNFICKQNYLYLCTELSLKIKTKTCDNVSYCNGMFLTLSSNTTVSFWGDIGAGHTGDACELYPCNLMTQNITLKWHMIYFKITDDSQITMVHDM